MADTYFHFPTYERQVFGLSNILQTVCDSPQIQIMPMRLESVVMTTYPQELTFQVFDEEEAFYLAVKVYFVYAFGRTGLDEPHPDFGRYPVRIAAEFGSYDLRNDKFRQAYPYMQTDRLHIGDDETIKEFGASVMRNVQLLMNRLHHSYHAKPV